MPNNFMVVIIIAMIISPILHSQTDYKYEASKLFFYNDQFGAIVKNSNAIVITTNGGQSWNEVSINSVNPLREILFTSEQNGWLRSDSTLFKSTDGGLTWVESFSSVMTFIKAVYFINENLGFIGGSAGHPDTESIIYFTNDAGQNWMKSQSELSWNDQIKNISFVNDSVGIAVSFSAIFKTRDYGKNWERLPIEFPIGGYQPVSATMLDEDDIILITDYPDYVNVGVLRESNDGGITWSNYGNQQTFLWGIEDSFILNKDTVWLTTTLQTYFTGNEGIYWDTLNVKIDEFSFVSKKEAYGMYDKYIIYTKDGWNSYSIIDSIITAVIPVNKIDNSFTLSQNYPNPFNPTTRIKYQVVSIEKVSLNIYDMLGRKIKTLVNEVKAPGSYELEFDGSDLTSGVYFYVLESGEMRLSRKMLLLK